MARETRRARHFTLLARQPPSIAAPPIDRQPPRRPDEPGAEPVAIAQASKAPIRPGERLLRDVLSVLTVPQHAECDAERERRRVGQPDLELAGERVFGAHQRAGKAIGKLGHSGFTSQDAADGRLVRACGLGLGAWGLGLGAWA